MPHHERFSEWCSSPPGSKPTSCWSTFSGIHGEAREGVQNAPSPTTHFENPPNFRDSFYMMWEHLLGWWVHQESASGQFGRQGEAPNGPKGGQLGHTFAHTRWYSPNQSVTRPMVDSSHQGHSRMVLIMAWLKAQLLLWPLEWGRRVRRGATWARLGP